MCMPNDTDELARILTEADYIDRCIELLNPRSPRAGGAQSIAPSLPDAGSGYADSRHDLNSPVSGGRAGDLECPEREGSPLFNQYEFERDTQATGV